MNYYINILNIICIRCCFYEISCSSLKTLITLFTHLVVAFMRYFVHLVWIKRVGDHRRVVELWILAYQSETVSLKLIHVFSGRKFTLPSIPEGQRVVAFTMNMDHLPWTWIQLKTKRPSTYSQGKTVTCNSSPFKRKMHIGR